MNDDDDKEVVAQACMSVADIIKDFGYVAVEPCMDMLVLFTGGKVGWGWVTSQNVFWSGWGLVGLKYFLVKSHKFFFI